MARKEISATEAIKAFAKSGIKVQEAKAVTLKGEDGKERPGFKTDDVPLREAHILSAADYGDRITIVTIDGRRHEARV